MSLSLITVWKQDVGVIEFLSLVVAAVSIESRFWYVAAFRL